MKASARFFIVVPLIVLAVLVIDFFRPPWTPLRVLGLALLVAFSGLLTVARLQLGNAFSITPQAHILVTRGIYSRIRHPVYVFSAAAVAGMCLYIGRPVLLLLFVVVVPLQIARARQEERVLTARFGEAYLMYKRSTWF